MQVDLRHQPALSLAVATLDPNESIKVEPGAMVSYSADITVETKAEGGFLGGLKRMFGGENFFQNEFTAGARGGEITLAHPLIGDMGIIEVDQRGFMLKSGGYIASEAGVSFDSQWGGARGFFSGAGLILLRVSGSGKLVYGCYGGVEPRTLAPGETYVVDTGHIVGFDATVNFQVQRIGGWKSTLLSGEGLVCHLTGPGRILMQTRSEEAFVQWLIPKLPSRTSSSSSGGNR
ncbi:MAG: TIGR00266 family protein [Chloroflexota bacterium]